jgi:hypothetical protein
MSKKALDSNLDFDGMAGDGVNRSGNRFAGNQYGATMPERVNKTYNKGNAPATATGIGKSVTKDAFKTAPDTAKGSVLGHRSWEPKMGQNYVGNADKINVGNK